MAAYKVSIETLPICGFLDLRGGEAIRAACSQCLGANLPTVANTLVCVADERFAFCISPDHWIVQIADGSEQDVLRNLETATANISHSFVDVSDVYSRIQVSGIEAREVLAQGVSIDIHPRVFPPGSTARTGLAKTTVQIHCVDESPTFIVTVFSSYQRHIYEWLQVASGKTIDQKAMN